MAHAVFIFPTLASYIKDNASVVGDITLQHASEEYSGNGVLTTMKLHKRPSRLRVSSLSSPHSSSPSHSHHQIDSTKSQLLPLYLLFTMRVILPSLLALACKVSRVVCYCFSCSALPIYTYSLHTRSSPPQSRASLSSAARKSSSPRIPSILFRPWNSSAP